MSADYISIETLYAHFLKQKKVQTDTRKIQQGDIFFALKGSNFDGNQFAKNALDAGARFAVVDDAAVVENEQYLLVPNVLEALQALAKHHRLNSKAIILGITGTNGKTTTKEIIAQVLSTQFKIIYTQGNLNNHIGVPLTLLSIQEDTEIAVVEMGANHIGEIAAYCEWARPDYGLITNIGKAHLEGFGSLEGVQKAKQELYLAVARYGKMIFQYKDAAYLKDLTPEALQVFSYGNNNAGVCGALAEEGLFAQVKVTAPQELAGIYNSQLVGGYNLPNILAAIAVGHFFKIEKQKIQSAIEQYLPSNSRSQLLHLGSNTLILDAYNANPSSLSLALENLSKLNASNKWVLMGAMKEMGENSIAEHQKIVQLALDLGLKQVLLVGKEFTAAGIQQFPVFETSEVLAAYLLENPIQDATILIKGSRGSKMEAVLAAFQI